ncbi:MAG: site-2 protease family protein, partial [Chloroflexi bacterium]|nr:site-2 protease family protein [Chloroflexota bacterium]
MEAALPDQTLTPLRSLLTDVFSITDARVLDAAAEAGAPDKAIEFRGQLMQSSDVAYRTLEPRFKDLGYTIVLQREGGADVVQALHGVEAARPPRLIINVVLLIATSVTTLMAGAIISGVLMRSPEVFLRRPALLLEGFPFAFTLLLILGIHEMGHYAAGRFHRTAVTLPYFIPMPPFGALPLGTLGAFIQLRSPIPHRRALFDIGVAGPLAGLVVAIGAFAIGLSTGTVSHGGSGLTLGRSIFTQFMIGLFQPEALQPGFGVQMNPIMLA